MIFLDANASMPPVAAAKEMLQRHLDATNASAPHALGRQSRRILDEAREALAACTPAREEEVVFTSGASEANRWLVESLLAEFDTPKILTSPLEHPSLAKPLLRAQEEKRIHLEVGRVDESGNLEFSEDQIHGAIALFATEAHNETGIILDLATLRGKLADETLIFRDGAQAFGRIDGLDDKADGWVISAHKMGGLQGVGALLLGPRARRLPAPWVGGGQEGDRRPGTEPLALIAAFHGAVQVLDETRSAHQGLSSFRDSLEEGITSALPNTRLLGTAAKRLPNTTAIVISNVDGEALRMAIDMAQICVGFGSACSALAPEPSKGLMALGVSPKEARSTIRLSLAPGISEEQVMAAQKGLIDVISRLPNG